MPRRKSEPSGSSDKPHQPMSSVHGRTGSTRMNASLAASRKKANKALRFSRYIFRVLNQIHPTLSLTNKAMKVMDDFMLDVFTRLVSEAAGLVKVTGKSTLSAKEFQTATKLLLPGELSKHAVNEATKAVSHFMKSKADDVKRKKSRVEIEMLLPNPPAVDVELEHPDTEEEEDDGFEEFVATAKRARLVPGTAAGSKDPLPEPGSSNTTSEQRPTVIQSGKNQPEKVVEKVSSSTPESLSNPSTPVGSPVATTSSEGRAEGVPQSAPSPATLERVLNETPKDQTEEVVTADMLSDSALTLPISGSSTTTVSVNPDPGTSSTNQDLTSRESGKESSVIRPDAASSECETLPLSQDTPSKGARNTGLDTPPASRDSTPWKVDPNRSSSTSLNPAAQISQSSSSTCSTIVELTTNPEQEVCNKKVTVKCTKTTSTTTTTTSRDDLD